MKVQQGTIPIGATLGLSRDVNDQVTGIYFNKETSSFSVLFGVIGVLVSIATFIFGNSFVAVVLFFLFASIFGVVVLYDKKQDEADGIKYSLADIDSVKIVDNTSMMTSDKSTSGSLGGAAVGGALLGGAGAIVGAISSGNNLAKEQVVNLGIKLKDKNWVIVRFEINQTLLGKTHKFVLESLLGATIQQQECPF